MESDSQQSRSATPILQVMICAYGREGLGRIAAASHPRIDGVEYLVSLQKDPYDEDYPLPDALDRDDFRLIVHTTKGLAVNRNVALAKSTAPLLLISDDDVDYTREGLKSVIKAFSENPDSDILTFQFESEAGQKQYPEKKTSLSKPPKGFFISSIEIAMRREAVQGKVWFNEYFGIGAEFPSGEEDIFMRDSLDLGLKGYFIPTVIARHSGTTTSARNLALPSRPQTKGAVFLRLHPYDWPLRMAVHTLREIPLWMKGLAPSPLSYCRNWLKGVFKAQSKKIFPTPDYPLYLQGHE